MTTEHPLPQLEIDEHNTLKYSLLGPSLTKSGQDNVDQQKVSKIVYYATSTNARRSQKSSTMPPKVPNSSTTRKHEIKT